MRKFALLAAVTILTLSVAATVKSLTPDMPAEAAAQAATISIDAIHHHVNMKSLLELEITDLY
jgi:hypothetical protein